MKRTLAFVFAAALVATSASAGQHGRRTTDAIATTATPTRSTIARNYNPAVIRNSSPGFSRSSSAGFSRSNSATLSRNSTLQRNGNGSNKVIRSANFNKNGHHHHHHHDHVVFIGGYPYWGYGYGYGFGYPYYGYGYPYSHYSSQYIYNGDAEYGDGYDQDQGGGSIVIEVQRRLAREGFYRGTIDGVPGSRTRYAIRAYKRAHGLRADSEIDSQLLGAMGLR